MRFPIFISKSNNILPHPYHPSVIYCDEGWNGYKFWMAETPFPPFDVLPYKDRYELPCIHCSNNGYDWKTIELNPIADLSAEQISNREYLSDTHLILKGKVLECYYRHMSKNDKRTIIIKKCSTDGVTWSEPIVIADTDISQDYLNWGPEIISPSFMWTGDKYICWYVNDTFTNERRCINVIESIDGIVWGKTKRCTLFSSDIYPWHIDVQFYNGAYNMVLYDVDHNALSHFLSSDGVNFNVDKVFLKPSGHWYDFFSAKLYRACSVKVKDKIYIYFSAHDYTRSSIGLISTQNWNEYSFIGGFSGVSKFVYVLTTIYLQSIHFINRCIRHFTKKYDFHSHPSVQ